MTITVVFDPPLPSDSPATFNTKAFSTLGDLNDWSTEANALATTVNSNASTASTGASTATTQAGIATTKASEASASALAADASADAAAASAASVVAIEVTTHAATSKTTPVDADEIPMSDSAASWGLKKLTWANLKATAKTYFDTLYQAVGTYVTPTTLNNGTLPASVTTLAATNLTTTGNTVLGNASTDTLNVGNGGIVKDASGNTSFGGSVLLTSVNGLGYGTGAGGTVTQATSKSTGVTLNKPTGQITMNGASLASGATVAFLLSNTVLTNANDQVVVSLWAGNANYALYSVAVATGSGGAYIIVKNEHTAALADAVVLNFTTIKGATS